MNYNFSTEKLVGIISLLSGGDPEKILSAAATYDAAHPAVPPAPEVPPAVHWRYAEDGKSHIVEHLGHQLRMSTIPDGSWAGYVDDVATEHTAGSPNELETKLLAHVRAL
jgi:hypothetical protein